MIGFDVNYLAILVAAIVAMIVGGLWYGPLFGKQWMALSGISKKSMSKMKLTPAQGYAVGFVTQLVLCFVYANIIMWTGVSTFATGALVGFWIWLGFFATTMLGMITWEGKPFNLYALNTLYYLVVLAIQGGILAIWM